MCSAKCSAGGLGLKPPQFRPHRQFPASDPGLGMCSAHARTPATRSRGSDREPLRTWYRMQQGTSRDRLDWMSSYRGTRSSMALRISSISMSLVNSPDSIPPPANAKARAPFAGQRLPGTGGARQDASPTPKPFSRPTTSSPNYAPTPADLRPWLVRRSSRPIPAPRSRDLNEGHADGAEFGLQVDVASGGVEGRAGVRGLQEQRGGEEAIVGRI